MCTTCVLAKWGPVVLMDLGNNRSPITGGMLDPPIANLDAAQVGSRCLEIKCNSECAETQGRCWDFLDTGCHVARKAPVVW